MEICPGSLPEFLVTLVLVRWHSARCPWCVSAARRGDHRVAEANQPDTDGSDDGADSGPRGDRQTRGNQQAAVYCMHCWFRYLETIIHTKHDTHTDPFNGPFSGTNRVSRYQKGKTNLDLTEARDSEWQWHQLGHMQVCISLQTDNHASTSPHKFFYRPDALPVAQPTASKH